VIASGKLPTVRSCRHVFLHHKDLDPWIEGVYMRFENRSETA
jgi:hypothetical protein